MSGDEYMIIDDSILKEEDFEALQDVLDHVGDKRLVSVPVEAKQTKRIGGSRYEDGKLRNYLMNQKKSLGHM